MKLMTLGQLDEAIGREEPIYIQSIYGPIGNHLVELTDRLRGIQCLMSWEISHLFTLENRKGVVGQVALPDAVVIALEVEEPDKE